MGIPQKEEYLKKAFSRNIGLIEREEQDKLFRTRVAIAGMGGVGGQYAVCLARLGVGAFNLADFDTFSVENINRQYGATAAGFDRPKVEVMTEVVKSINPYADVKVFSEATTESNIDQFFDGVDIALDAIDFFNIKARRLYYRKAYEKGIPVVGAGPVGFGVSALTFMPGGMTFDEYFDINDSLTEKEMTLRFALGLAPALLQRAYFDPSVVDFANQKAPSSCMGVLLCAGVVGGEVLKIVGGRGDLKPVPHSIHFDPFVRKCKVNYLPRGNRGLLQRLKLVLMRKKIDEIMKHPRPPLY